MPLLQQKPRLQPARLPAERISTLDSARYTIDLLENLRKMAAGQGQVILVHLLELAQAEARMVARDHKGPG